MRQIGCFWRETFKSHQICQALLNFSLDLSKIKVEKSQHRKLQKKKNLSFKTKLSSAL